MLSSSRTYVTHPCVWPGVARTRVGEQVRVRRRLRVEQLAEDQHWRFSTASCARMRDVARNALAPRAGAFGELEDQHPCQHCRDEHDRLELAGAERYKRWAGTESG